MKMMSGNGWGPSGSQRPLGPLLSAGTSWIMYCLVEICTDYKYYRAQTKLNYDWPTGY